MGSLGARITQAREAARLSQSELARRLSVKPPTINKWEYNVTAPSREHLRELAIVLDASVAWLLYGQSTLTEPNGNGTIPPLRTLGAVVAMVTLNQAAAREIPSNPSATINTVVPIDGDACAFALPDDSNAPEHPAGNIWAVSYEEKPRPGDMVVARYGPNLDPILGTYSIATTDQGRVRIVTPRNPLWPAARSDIEPLEVVAVMVAEIIPRRR